MIIGKRPREMIILVVAVGRLKQEIRDEKRAPLVINIDRRN
jgi:hypothetical protein